MNESVLSRSLTWKVPGCMKNKQCHPNVNTYRISEIESDPPNMFSLVLFSKVNTLVLSKTKLHKSGPRIHQTRKKLEEHHPPKPSKTKNKTFPTHSSDKIFSCLIELTSQKKIRRITILICKRTYITKIKVNHSLEHT